jgi:hypothetical protein
LLTIGIDQPIANLLKILFEKPAVKEEKSDLNINVAIQVQDASNTKL